MSFDLRDHIVVLENIVPFDLCDAILREYSFSNEWVDTNTKGGIQKDVRSAQTILMSIDPVININPSVRKNLDSDLFNCASKAIVGFKNRFPLCEIEQDSGYEILRYRTNEFYTQHTDSFKDAPRAVSCSFSLNDDYSGGEFAFFNRHQKIKAPKGSALLFPSNFMYPHEILPVINGTRYSIITWFV